MGGGTLCAMQRARSQIAPRTSMRPVSLVMLNLLIVMIAIGSFDFALSLLNLARHFTPGAARSPAGLLMPVVHVLIPLLLVVVAGVLINRAVVKLRARLPAPPVSE